MKQSFYAFILVFSLLFCGCSSNTPTPETTSITVPPVVEPTASETTVATELITEPTIDPNSLQIDAGTFLNKFIDPVSDHYLEYYTFIPEKAVKDMPLIIFLHGDGETHKIDALERIALVENAKEYYGEEFPFIAIAPGLRQKSWCEGLVPRTLLALIEDTASRYEIDRNKIIITGFSRGAIGTWYYITNHTDIFSCAVPVSCPNEYPVLYHNLKEVPIWGFVGEKEEYYSQKMAEIINWTSEIGGDAKLSVIEDMSHTGMDKAAYTQETIEWMLTQNKEKK